MADTNYPSALSTEPLGRIAYRGDIAYGRKVTRVMTMPREMDKRCYLNNHRYRDEARARVANSTAL